MAVERKPPNTSRPIPDDSRMPWPEVLRRVKVHLQRIAIGRAKRAQLAREHDAIKQELERVRAEMDRRRQSRQIPPL